VCFVGCFEGLLKAVDLKLQAVLDTVLLVGTGCAKGFEVEAKTGLQVFKGKLVLVNSAGQAVRGACELLQSRVVEVLRVVCTGLKVVQSRGGRGDVALEFAGDCAAEFRSAAAGGRRLVFVPRSALGTGAGCCLCR